MDKTIGTCKNCKHWKNPDKNEYWGSSEAAMPRNPNDKDFSWPLVRDADEQRKLFGYATAYCRSDELGEFIRPTKGAASVVDGSEYKAALITGEDFGCINFETKYIEA